MSTRHERKAVRSIVVLAVAASVATVGCGRSSGPATSGQSSAPSSVATTSPSASATVGVGDFGTLKGICGPGNANGGIGRGVTSSTIRIGTTADPGAAAVPGLEQEFFDVADGFTKWCNAAGGINGRKIILDKLDAKLFDVGQITVDACQKDFMLVGGGNAFDSASVKPREACKLGSMPAYAVSPEAAKSKYQVTAYPAIATKFPIGSVRLLTEAYPAAKTGGVAIGGSNLASLIPTGRKIQEALQQLDVKVTTIQAKPPLVDNFRPYMEQLKNDKAVGLYEYSGVDATPEVQAMSNVGYSPSFLLLTSNFFGPDTVAAAKTTKFPPTYAGLQHLPFELSDQFPVMAQAKAIVQAAVAKPALADFTAIAFDAWTLWAKSATACGSDLTMDCVLARAGAEKDWTGGGMFPPVTPSPTDPTTTGCVLLMRLTTDGWVYDKKATNPDNGVYNCDPKNLATVKTYQ